MKLHKLLFSAALLATGVSVTTAQNAQQQWQQQQQPNNWQQQQSWAPPPFGLWRDEKESNCFYSIEQNGTITIGCRVPGKREPVGGVMNYSWQPTSPYHGILTPFLPPLPAMSGMPQLSSPPPPTIYHIEWVNQNRLKVGTQSTRTNRIFWSSWIRSGTSGQ